MRYKKTKWMIMNRCDVGVILGTISGVMSLLESTIFFSLSMSSVKIMEYLIAWYLVATGLAILVLLAALMVHNGNKILGGTLMLLTSLSLPVNLTLLLISGPVGNMLPVLYYHPQPASSWLLLSMIGGILILSIKMKQLG